MQSVSGSPGAATVQEQQATLDAAPGDVGAALDDDTNNDDDEDTGSQFGNEYDSVVAEQRSTSFTAPAPSSTHAPPATASAAAASEVTSSADVDASGRAQQQSGADADSDAASRSAEAAPFAEPQAAPAPDPPAAGAPPPARASLDGPQRADAAAPAPARPPAPRARELDDAFDQSLDSETARALLSPSLSSGWAAPQGRGRPAGGQHHQQPQNHALGASWCERGNPVLSPSSLSLYAQHSRLTRQPRQTQAQHEARAGAAQRTRRRPDHTCAETRRLSLQLLFSSAVKPLSLKRRPLRRCSSFAGIGEAWSDASIADDDPGVRMAQ